MLRPWSEFTLRIVLALFDGATLIILLIALRSLDLPYSLVAVYWWNPLVVRETFNTMHLDVIALPFALAAVFLTIRGRHLWAARDVSFCGSCQALAYCLFAANSVASAEETKAGIAFIWDFWIDVSHPVRSRFPFRDRRQFRIRGIRPILGDERCRGQADFMGSEVHPCRPFTEHGVDSSNHAFIVGIVVVFWGDLAAENDAFGLQTGLGSLPPDCSCGILA